MMRPFALTIALLLTFSLQSFGSVAPRCESIFSDDTTPISASQIISKERVSIFELENFIASYLEPSEAQEFKQLVADLPGKSRQKTIQNEQQLASASLEILELANQTRFDQLRRQFHWAPRFDNSSKVLQFQSFLLQYQEMQMSFLKKFHAEINNFQFQNTPRHKALLRNALTYLLKGFFSYDLVLFKAMRDKPGEFQIFSRGQIITLRTVQGFRELISVTSRYYSLVLGLFAACLAPDIVNGLIYYHQLESFPTPSPIMVQSTTHIRAAALDMLKANSTSEHSSTEKKYLEEFQQILSADQSN